MCVCVCVPWTDHMSLLILPLTCWIRLRLLCFQISNKWGWRDNSKYLDIFFMPCKSHMLFLKSLFPLGYTGQTGGKWWQMWSCDQVFWWDLREEDPETDVFCLFSSHWQQSGLVLQVFTAAWLSGIMIFQTLMGRSLGFGLQVFRTARRRPTQQMESSTTSSKDS